MRDALRSSISMLVISWQTSRSKIVTAIVLTTLAGLSWPMLALALKSGINAAIAGDTRGAAVAGGLVGATAIGALILQCFLLALVLRFCLLVLISGNLNLIGNFGYVRWFLPKRDPANDTEG